jgi:predicted nucleic acid-binding protein
LPNLTLDTGALIALSRRERFMLSLVMDADKGARVITVPTVVLTEWWRGPGAELSKLLRGFTIEPLSQRIALLAGEALAGLSGPSIADAIVMASAAQRGDAVVTGDFDDLNQLRRVFPAVRLFGMGNFS